HQLLGHGSPAWERVELHTDRRHGRVGARLHPRLRGESGRSDYLYRAVFAEPEFGDDREAHGAGGSVQGLASSSDDDRCLIDVIARLTLTGPGSKLRFCVV